MTNGDVDVRPGQVWAAVELRETGRTIRVDAIEYDSRADRQIVVCTVLTNRNPGLRSEPIRDMRGRTTRTPLDRFRPAAKAYRLDQDALPVGES